MNELKLKSAITEQSVLSLSDSAKPHLKRLAEDVKQAKLLINGAKPKKGKESVASAAEGPVAKRAKQE